MNTTCYMIPELCEKQTQQKKYLSFMIGSAMYGVEMQNIRKIVGLHEMTAMPFTADHYKGIICVNGTIIPVMDVRGSFFMQQNDNTDNTCIIVLDIMGSEIGFIIDKVSEVLSISPDNYALISAPNNPMLKYVHGIGRNNNKAIFLLECETLVIDSAMYALSEIA